MQQLFTLVHFAVSVPVAVQTSAATQLVKRETVAAAIKMIRFIIGSFRVEMHRPPSSRLREEQCKSAAASLPSNTDLAVVLGHHELIARSPNIDALDRPLHCSRAHGVWASDDL